jgi:transcriptional regulator of acetoin/glycerol metabolism
MKATYVLTKNDFPFRLEPSAFPVTLHLDNGHSTTRKSPRPHRRRSYSDKFKEALIKEVKESKGKYTTIAKKHNIPHNTLFQWVKGR